MAGWIIAIIVILVLLVAGRVDADTASSRRRDPRVTPTQLPIGGLAVSGERADRVVRATELLGKPVVTLAGDDLADVRDVVFDSERGDILGFTLNKRSWFGGRLKERLTAGAVHAIGRDAVMVGSDADLIAPAAAPDEVADPPSDRDVIGATVLTDDGVRLGEVVDLIVALGGGARAVGYEIQNADDDPKHARFIPLPEQMAVSGDALVVPKEVDSFIRDDLAGFGAAVAEFRERLHEGGAP